MPSLEEIGSENEIKWFDHHDWSGIKRPENTQINIDITKCGAELVAEEYLPEDEIASKIAQLARAQDFMEENELAWKLYDVISAGFNKSKLVKFLSRGIFWNVELETCYRDYQYKRKKGFDYLDKHSKLYRIGDWTCLLGFSKPYLSSTIAAGHLLEKNPDFVVCVWPNGKLSFRRNNPEVGLREMAALFNGGGRDSAAGGNYGATVTEKEYMRVFDKIVERINLAYAGLKASQ
jgi:oligoribonuclease NrnB/cAMP/cGMP phosphodiesterase (DHH superfamily)